MPEPFDEILEAHRLIQLQIVLAAGFLLTDEGLPPELAGRFTTAFLAV